LIDVKFDCWRQSWKATIGCSSDITGKIICSEFQELPYVFWIVYLSAQELQERLTILLLFFETKRHLRFLLLVFYQYRLHDYWSAARSCSM
jgi:hypothetical protein